MSHKVKAGYVSLLMFGLSFLPLVTKDLPVWQWKAIVFIGLAFSWNYLAFAFGRQMFPVVFQELQGNEEGKPSWREFWFWLTALMHGLTLMTVAFAN